MGLRLRVIALIFLFLLKVKFVSQFSQELFKLESLNMVYIHCNAIITRVTGAIKSNRVISDTAL